MREAAAEIPAEVRERLDTADKLSDEDRETIIEIARKALEEFQSKPKPKQNQETKDDAKLKASIVKSDPEAKPEEPEPDPRTEKDTQLKAQAEPQLKNEGKLDESKPEPEEKS